MSALVKLEDFGKAFVPHMFRPNIRKYLLKAGYIQVPYSLFGGLFLLSVLISAIFYIFLIFPSLKGLNSLSFMILTFVFWAILQSLVIIVLSVLFYLRVDIKIYKRTKEMENVLEEFLRYVSENLKGGMTFDKALWEAIRPQYGTLADEVKLVAKRVITGQDVSEALIDFTGKYDSPMLKRSFQLIVEGMKGGGNIAYIIDRVEKDIRDTKELKKEMVAANSTYVIFMTAIVLVIAPALFGLSYNLLLVLEKIGGTLSTSLSGNASSFGALASFSNINIKPEIFRSFSIWALGVIAFFASLITAIIQKGSVKEGLKYIPIFIIVSILMYLLFKAIMGVMFAGMIQI